MKKKYITKLVAISLAAFMTTSIYNMPAYAQPVDDASLQEVIQNIQECDSKITDNMEKINEYKEMLQEKEDAIKENESKVQLAKEDISEKNDQLAERLKKIQVNGGLESTPMMYLNALFSSDNLLDVINNVKLISEICTSDKKLVVQAKEAESNLEEIQTEIKKETEKLTKEKESLEDYGSKLEEEKQNLLDYVKENSELLSLDSSSTIIPITIDSDISDEAKAIIQEAQKYLGIPYLWGGTTPAGFDCSGLMQYVFASQGISIPRVSQAQQSFAQPISMSEIKPGDLVFNKSSNSTHVGMYIGNDLFIHAPHTGDVIKITKLSTSNMKYAGRILED